MDTVTRVTRIVNSGQERLIITSSGNLLVGGGFQPNQKLYVYNPFEALSEIEEPVVLPKADVTEAMVDIYLKN